MTGLPTVRGGWIQWVPPSAPPTVAVARATVAVYPRLSPPPLLRRLKALLPTYLLPTLTRYNNSNLRRGVVVVAVVVGGGGGGAVNVIVVLLLLLLLLHSVSQHPLSTRSLNTPHNPPSFTTLATNLSTYSTLIFSPPFPTPLQPLSPPPFRTPSHNVPGLSGSYMPLGRSHPLTGMNYA